mmetsp:Transcript_24473/g.61182  ORF Transcript_24473/g.61182 Transcript_24473/m.61182 type:complete len:116 (-) Transcript_24473:738-1085(-)
MMTVCLALNKQLQVAPERCSARSAHRFPHESPAGIWPAGLPGLHNEGQQATTAAAVAMPRIHKKGAGDVVPDSVAVVVSVVVMAYFTVLHAKALCRAKAKARGLFPVVEPRVVSK